jgi:hypothetical protein
MRPARDHGHPAGASDSEPPGSAAGSTALRISLGSTLRQLREQAGISRDVAGDAIRASVAKMSRLELGRVGFKLRDIADLLTLYGVTDPAGREELLELARQANKPGWWHRYSDLLPAAYQTYIGLEQAASVIRTFELQFVPALLQTPDYARAVTMLTHREGGEIQRRVELRMHRKRLLSQDRSPVFWAVIDESALRRSVCADPNVLREQLDHLLAMSARLNVTVQVIPLGFRGYVAPSGSFTLLRFADPNLPDLVYLEHLTSALYLDKPSEVDHYTAVMSRLVASVEPPEKTPEIVRRIRDQL